MPEKVIQSQARRIGAAGLQDSVLVQLHPWLGAAADSATQHQHQRAEHAVQRHLVHAVQRDVEHPRQPAFEHDAAGQVAHQVAHRRRTSTARSASRSPGSDTPAASCPRCAASAISPAATPVGGPLARGAGRYGRCLFAGRRRSHRRRRYCRRGWSAGSDSTCS